MHSQQHYNTTSRTSQRRQQHFTKNNRPTCIPSSNQISTSSNQHDPFANMNTYVDYQQKIESLKTSLVSTKSSGPPSTTKKLDDPAQRTRPLNSIKRHHSRQPSFTIDITEDEVGRLWSNGSVMSSGSSSSGASSNGCLTPPRSSSPIATANHQSHNDDDSDSCYVTMEDKVRFLAFLRHRTGWHTEVTDTTMDLDYMKNSSSLFFWYG